MKKLSYLMPVLLMWQALPGQAWAAEAQEDTYLTMEQQQEIVRQVKQIGIRVGVASYNPAKLQVSCPMPIYAYTEEGFRENGRLLPLLFEEQPLFFVVDDGDNYTINTTIYDWLLQAKAAVGKPFALVWDRNSVYFYDGKSWLLLHKLSHTGPDYAVLDIYQPIDTAALELCELRPVQSLEDAYFERWPGDEEVAVYFAGEKQETHGWLSGGRTLLPLRDLCNMLDISVDYDEATQQITLNNRQDVYTLRLNDCQASCNGRQLALMDVPPQERDGVTYLPMRYLAGLLQLEVQWDEAARRVDLQSDGQATKR